MKMLPLSTRVLAAAAWSALLFLSVGAGAQELKIGYVNSERVLREAAPAKAAQTRLEASSASARRNWPSRARG